MGVGVGVGVGVCVSVCGFIGVCVSVCVFMHMHSVAQSRLTLSDPMDYSLPDSSVYEIF